MHRKRFVLFIAALVCAACLNVFAQDVPVETYTLPNGLTVILHVDHKLPQATIDTWFQVGSKDEARGRTGFAHLFEHLMFMGTKRVPRGQFDVIMESGGGANNASTASDRTNYYSWGPSSLLPTLLWLDADRMEGLGKAMTQEKLDLQRKVVLNERRQSYENRPYGKAWLMIPEALFPPDHPYHHPVIGSAKDLEAATLKDVKDFFSTYYVPGNASLVVAGDFDKAAVKKVIAETFGAVPAQPLPVHRTAPPVVLDHEVRRMATDKVKYPRIWLVWPSPKAYADGDAQMELAASILADGDSGRLYKRLVLDDRIAQNVYVYQDSRELCSEFVIDVTAARGADLGEIKHAVMDELARFKKDGPTESEMKRVKASAEAHYLRMMESLRRRADMLNEYYHYFGRPNSFKRVLATYTTADAASVKKWADKVLGEGRVDMRILPEGAEVKGANLDKRPADFPPAKAHPPVPEKLVLANGIPLYVVSRPGTGLFSGMILVKGGERMVPSDKAGLSGLAASMLTDGAGKRDASAYADAVASLGASVRAAATWHDFKVRVSGLTSKLDPTLDLFADAVVRPRLSQKDFDREKDLLLSEIQSRVERPDYVAVMAARRIIFGPDDARGRPRAGFESTVKSIDLADVKRAVPRLINAANAEFLFVGDFDPKALKAALDERFGGWKVKGEKAPALPAALAKPAPGRLVLVDRPGAPQTVLYMMRPVAPEVGAKSATQRESLNTVFGGSFTSRLMQNIREKHGYSYGAASMIWREGNQFMLGASSSVQTAVTGPALHEFKKEFDAMATGDVTAKEFDKARKTVRYDLVSSAGTTSSLEGTLGSILSNGQPVDWATREVKALDALSLDSANAEAKSGLFGWNKLLVVLVGDKKAVLPQLEKAGFPKPELVDPEGEPVKAEPEKK